MKCKSKAILLTFIFALTCLTGCENKKKEDKANESDMSVGVVLTTENKSCYVLPFNNVIKSGGTVIIELLYSSEDLASTLNAEDITFTDGFSADVTIGSDSDPCMRSIVLTNISAEDGKYMLQLAKESISTELLVQNDVSDYASMSCVTSETSIKDKSTITLFVHYVGVDDAKYLNLYLDESKVKFYNCTGDLAFLRADNSLSSCITVSNLTFQDKTKPCYIEILEGSATDIDGNPVNGTIIEYNLIEE